jgi:hypothetical protein
MDSIQMNTIIAATASVLEKTTYAVEGKKTVSKYNPCIVHERQQQQQQQQHQPPGLEDKYILPVSLRLHPDSFCYSNSSSTIAADLDVLNTNHTSLDQLLEHLIDRYDMMSSKDQDQEDATVTAVSTMSLSRSSSSSSSSTMKSTTIASTSTSSAAKSSLKRRIRIVNDNSDNEIVSSTQRFDDNNNQSSNHNSTKRRKYARRNSIVIRDIEQLSRIATDLSKY